MKGVAVVARPDGRAVTPSHPVFGAILDLGSYGALEAPEEVVRTIVAELDPDLDWIELASQGRDGNARAELESLLEGGFVLLVAPGEDSAVVAFAGGGLPSMGPLPPLTPDLLRRSLEYALGRRGSLEGTVFAEPAVSTADEERRLRERLHELYGE